MESAPAVENHLPKRQEAACATAISAHINGPVDARWLSEANGIATIETIDGNRRHLCTVDGSGKVTGYSHPR